MRLETDNVAFVLPSRDTARPLVQAESGPSNHSLVRRRAPEGPLIQDVSNGLNGGLAFSKLIGELINEDQIILGREESKGLSIKGHYPKKDGVIASRLQAEAVASRQ